jgi:hypothetical protein
VFLDAVGSEYGIVDYGWFLCVFGEGEEARLQDSVIVQERVAVGI